jgi:hypothetical protein
MSMPKAGGTPVALLELPRDTVAPVGVGAERLIVSVPARDGSFSELAKGGGQLSELAPGVPAEGKLVGGRFYWLETADNGETRLHRAQLDGSSSAVLARIDGTEFEVGPSYVLWKREHLVTSPRLLLEQNFVMLDEGAGCIRTLPGVGESISFQVALDGTHAYWHSYNAVGAVSSEGPLPPPMPLYRVNVQSGAIQHIETPGFEAAFPSAIAAQDAERIYVAGPSALFAVEKP